MPLFNSNLTNGNQPICNVFVGPPFDPTQGALEKTQRALLNNSFKALIDTGATHSCVTKNVTKKLDLTAVSKGSIQNTGGSSKVNQYKVTIGIPILERNRIDQKSNVMKGSLTVPSFTDLTVLEIAPQNGFDVILGMDIITKGSLYIMNDFFVFAL